MSQLTERQVLCLQEMGIVIWKRPLEERNASKQDAATHTAWLALQQQAMTCKACPLHQSRQHVVFGVGSLAPSLLIVGEAPGQHEDLQGEPFVGRAGQLLNQMLHAIGLKREAVYITNVIKCRPPNNRDPLPSEVATCTPFLEKQVHMLKPRVILALGRYAAHYLLDTTQSLSKLRGSLHQFRSFNIPLIVSYHPAYLLRNPVDKKKSYEDLKVVYNLLHNA